MTFHDEGAHKLITVLVVDDSLVVRAVVRSRLEEEGYRVVEAVDGVAALDECRQAVPDVVLLDVEMPGIDGREVLRRLKADPGLADIPVVFLTARIGMADVVDGLRSGAHDYLRKPFEPEELVARVAAAAHVKKLQDRLRERNAALETMSRTDLLTGLYNRRHLSDVLTRQHAIAQRNTLPLGVILLDLDHFKQVNDTYGHAAGDQVLCEVARRMRGQLRTGDVAGRWGGEEFLVVLPDSDDAGAAQVAERIRTALAVEPVHFAGHDIAVTMSAGCAVDAMATPQELISLADTCLYRAKETGRDRVVAWHGGRLAHNRSATASASETEVSAHA
jgi:two-component system cell cycle response regulator